MALIRGLVFLILASASAHAYPPDSKLLDREREILRELFANLSAPVDTKACDLKPKAGARVKVSDLILGYVVWSTQKDRDGVTKKPRLGCQASSNGLSGAMETCNLTAGESIKIPGEPEGWSRSLIFEYDTAKKKIPPKSFRCLDVP